MSLEMTVEEYYSAPPDNVFQEIKEAALAIWSTYDDTHGYASNKIKLVEPVQNVADNAWYLVAMFDQDNQAALLSMVGDETAELIRRARGY